MHLCLVQGSIRGGGYHGGEMQGSPHFALTDAAFRVCIETSNHRGTPGKGTQIHNSPQGGSRLQPFLCFEKPWPRRFANSRAQQLNPRTRRDSDSCQAARPPPTGARANPTPSLDSRRASCIAQVHAPPDDRAVIRTRRIPVLSSELSFKPPPLEEKGCGGANGGLARDPNP